MNEDVDLTIRLRSLESLVRISLEARWPKMVADAAGDMDRLREGIIRGVNALVLGMARQHYNQTQELGGALAHAKMGNAQLELIVMSILMDNDGELAVPLPAVKKAQATQAFLRQNIDADAQMMFVSAVPLEAGLTPEEINAKAKAMLDSMRDERKGDE